MKAAVLEHINGPLVVAEVGLTPLTRGQVLVRVLMSGICGSQLQEIAGYKGNAKFVPHLMGHEGAGIVQEVGEGVTTVKPGDKVVMHWRKGEGIEADFPTYVYKGKEIRSGKVTTFSEYSIVSENRVTAVPHDTPNELCALLGCSLSTALGAVNAEAKLQPGETMLIVGAGGLGANLLRAAKIAQAGKIILIDIHEHKREWVRGLGADLYVNTAAEDLRGALLAGAGLTEVDVIVDTSGAKRAIEATLPLLSGKGRFIMLGQPKPGETIELQDALHMFGGDGKSIKATQGGKFAPHEEIPRYLALHKSGTLRVDDLITHRIRLDEVNDALDLLRKGRAARVLIDFNSNPVKPSLLDSYKRMLLLRVAEEELVQLYLDEKLFSMVHFYVGQEAVGAGVCSQLNLEDKVLSTHRSHGHYLAKGGNLKRMVCELLGRSNGAARGKGGSMHMIDKSVNFVGSTPLLGSAIPLAAGVAFEEKYNKKDGVVVGFMGDGASEEGVVYETYNLAALYELPLLLVIENNTWSVNSNIAERRGKKYDIGTIAKGFGLPYLRADGNDFNDVSQKAATLLAGIRAGGGPAVLECLTYRHMAHSTPLMDDKHGLRKEDTLERRLQRDSMKLMRSELLSQGVADEARLKRMEEEARAEVREAIAFAKASPYPQKEEMFTDVFYE